MRKRILSLLLALCMLVSLLPVSAIAAWMQEDELYLQMLELGLVDQNGQLVENNRFTMENGTQFSTLSELTDWLHSLDEQDFDLQITIDATGKTATAEQLMQVLNIEYQIAAVSEQLNLLASTPAEKMTLHDATLSMNAFVTSGIFYVTVCLTDKSGSIYQPADGQDICLELGLFSDVWLDDTSTSDELFGGFGVKNGYRSIVLTADDGYTMTLSQNLADLRSQSAFQNKLTWAGNEHILVEVRTAQTVDGNAYTLPSQSVSCQLTMSRKSYSTSNAHLTTEEEDIANQSLKVAGYKDGSVIPYKSTPSYNKTTQSGTDYFQFTIDSIVTSNYSSFSLYQDPMGWEKWYRDLIDVGMGDSDDQKLIVQEMAVLVKKKSSSNKVNAVNLYVADENGDLTVASTGQVYSGSELSSLDIGKYGYAHYLSNLSECSAGEFLKLDTNMENKLESEDWQLIRFTNVEIPVWLDSRGNLAYSTNFYLPVDYIKQDSKNSITPDSIMMFGIMQLKDTTAPTVESIQPLGEYEIYYPGDTVPIAVTFSEPVRGSFELLYLDGTEVKALSQESPNADTDVTGDLTHPREFLSDTRVFYYTVGDADASGIRIVGVRPLTTGINCTDARCDYGSKSYQTYNNIIATDATDSTYGNYIEWNVTLLENGSFRGMRPQDSIGTITVSQGETLNAFTVQVTLSDKTEFKQAWANLDSGTFSGVEGYIVVDGDTDSMTDHPVYCKNNTLLCDLTLDEVSEDTEHTLELWLNTIGSSGGIYYGTYATVTQQATVYPDDTAYTITLENGWPSGVDNTVYAGNNASPVFTAQDNGQSFTYKQLSLLEWRLTDGEDVVRLKSASGTGDDFTLSSSPAVTIETIGEGEAELQLYATGGGKDLPVSAPLRFTVIQGDTPYISASTTYARQGTDVVVTFSSNLYKHEQAEYGTFSAALFPLDEDGNVLEDEPLFVTYPDWTASSVTVPGEYLQTISRDDAPVYVLRLRAAVQVNDSTVKEIVTDAPIVVRSQPAAITLTGLDSTYFMGGDTIRLGWTVDNFDLDTNPEACAFELKITKNGDTVYETTEKRTSGSYSLSLDEPAGLSENYLISVKAKNGADPTWSRAAATITVYRNHALDILVGGESVDSLTLGNTVSDTATTTSPTITAYGGKTYGGLNTAQDIAALRTALGLMESVSINFSDYDWSTDTDRICWSTSTGQGTQPNDAFGKAVTVNYREGLNYAPLESYSYTSYIPEVILTLCGINSGTNQITATHHALNELTDTITVQVERLQNKLYLFQFTPAVLTEVSYTDGLGEQHTVYSNDDGSLALFEPNGIASEVCTASISGGIPYRGTLSRYALKSGEGNGIYGELYPLNALELRRAAVAEVQLLKPDGTPLARTDVTLRGGVYRNRYAAQTRDDAYCADAMFAQFPQQAATLDGKQDQVFTTDENGVLTVYMDLLQFTSQNDPDPVGVGDSLEFIFELRFANDSYQPELVVVDSSLTKRDALRSGEDIVTLTEADAARPFVAVQTVSYTGRNIDVRNYTGVVGPSSTYPQAQLDTMVMLWGTDAALTDTNYTFDLREQNTGISLPEQQVQSPASASFPFSSIPLVSETVTLDSDSFVNYTASKKTPMEAALYSDSGSLVCTLPLTFGLVDLTAIEKVQDAPSLLALMTNLEIYGSVGGANTKYGLVNAVSDVFLKDGLSLVEELGGQMGTLKAVLTPTEDPTRYEAYLWTGLNTTKLGDLDYDQEGIAIEPSYIGQDYDSLLGQVNDTFTLSDFQAMADGSYFDDRGSLYGAVSQGVLQLPIMLQLEGWVSTEIRYNFDKGEWEVLTTGGGFTAGVQVEFEKAVNGSAYGIPITASFKIRGGVVVDFQTAIRYAQQLGMEWDDDTASRVNDYLTALRLNAYFEFFAGVGHDKGFTAKLGTFGSLEINNENRFLTRSYLKNPDDRDLDGQFLQLDGEVGIRAALGVGPLVSEWTMVSIGFSNATFSFNDWSDINEYWEDASSGLGGTGWDYENGGTNLAALRADGTLLISQPTVKTQSRDYLETADRQWLGDNMGVATLSLDEHSTLSALETNAYPYATPLLSDDGSMLIYLSDADSTDLADVELRYSLSDGGSFPDGTAIPAGSDGFSGYGDSSPDFAGTADFAGAVWLREGATLDLKPDVTVSEEQQIALLRGMEVTASIWDGSRWNTTRLTDNDTQELEPVIAVNENGQAIAVWRSVQFGDSIFSFTENRIFCKIYDNGSWSEEYLLYNGSTGDVSGMDVALLNDGTAAIAFSLESDDAAGEIYYTVLDIESETPEDDARTLRASTNDWADENPRIIAVDDWFVLGWVSAQDGSGAEQTDLALRLLDNTGAPQSGFPASLGQLVSTAAFDGQFTFVRGAQSPDTLSILWNDADAGESDNDVLRAIKLGTYNGSYGASAAITVAELPAHTRLDHMDACITSADGTGIQAVLQGVTQDAEHGTTQPYTYTTSYDGKTETHTVHITIPGETTNLYSASANYADAVQVTGIHVDFSTLTTDSIIPVTFDITNQGMNLLDSVTVTLGTQSQTFSGLALLPGQSRSLSATLRTGSVIEDLPYTVKATFERGQTAQEDGTLYLDYPDVGISALTVTREQDGIRTVLVNLYNQSAASLNKPNRRVVLGVYSDPQCETPVDGSFFADGTDGQPYERILSGDTLAALDTSGSTQSFTFDIGAYVDAAEGDLTEIPESGITLFVRAQAEQLSDGQWLTLPEADTLNNQKHITFDSLLTRSGSLPVTSSVSLENGKTTTAHIRLKNNSLCENTTGYLVAALLDDSGKLLETRNLGDLSLSREQVEQRTIAFSQLGTRVVLRYAEPVSEDSANANAANITLDGTTLSLASFDAEHQAVMTNIAPGNYLLIVTPEDANATVTVNSRRTDNGMMTLTMRSNDAVFVIRITSADGTATESYVLTLQAVPKTDEPTIPAPVGPSVPAVDEPDEPETPENPFTDVLESHWFYEDVLYAYRNGLMNGTGNGLFSPDGTTTRGMVVTILHRLAGTPEPETANAFPDVPAGSYCETAVRWASEHGIVNGYSNGCFGPNDPVTREQLATLLYRFAQYLGIDVSVGEDTNILSYADAFDVSGYAMPPMQWACGAGILNGTSSSTLSPKDSASRAQTAAILHRFRENYLR